MNTEYELFDVAMRRWLESLKTTVVATTFAATKATTIKTAVIAEKKTIALKILLSSLLIIAMIVVAVAVYIMLIVRRVIRSPPSWTLRCLPRRLRNLRNLRNRPASNQSVGFLQNIGGNLSDDESYVLYTQRTNSVNAEQYQDL